MVVEAKNMYNLGLGLAQDMKRGILKIIQKLINLLNKVRET